MNVMAKLAHVLFVQLDEAVASVNKHVPTVLGALIALSSANVLKTMLATMSMDLVSVSVDSLVNTVNLVIFLID